MNNGTDPKSPKFYKKLGLVTGYHNQVLTEILMQKTEAELQFILTGKKQMRNGLFAMFDIEDAFIEEKEEWRKFYQKHFSLDINFNDLFIPEKPDTGSWRLIFIAKGLTMNRAFEQSLKFFRTWKHCSDLDKEIPTNSRNAKENYAVWVRDGIEPDAKHLGKSTRQSDSNMRIGITVLERIILEIKYFLETGSHLDIKSTTFCSGSRFDDGAVPGCCWYLPELAFKVKWFSLDNSDSWDGVRSVVS